MTRNCRFIQGRKVLTEPRRSRQYLWENTTLSNCVLQPIHIAYNVTFVIDKTKFSLCHDVMCDDKGKWIHKGSPKKLVEFKEVDGGISIKLVDHINDIASNELQTDGIFTLKSVYYESATSPDLRKIISTLHKEESSTPLTSIQYVFKNTEHEVKNILAHGNCKKRTSFLRLKPTIIGKMRATVESKKTPKRI